MSFLHVSLIAGLAAITVPMLLHLFGQRQPKLIDFPALRFVQQTATEQRTSWQLRHFLLLMLRMLLLAALALALARPRVHSAQVGSILGVTGVGVVATLATLIAAVAWSSRRPKAITATSLVVALCLWSLAGWWLFRSLSGGPVVPTADQSAPVAAVLIIDNGPTMGYRSNNSLRLEAARDIGLWILDKLPLDSRVAVLTGAPVGRLVLDPASAKAQVRLIETRGAHVDLVSRIATAIDLVLGSELQRKEVYVITDLTAVSWAAAQADVQSVLKAHAGEVLLQIIDVGSEDNANWRLGDVALEYATVPEGGDAVLRVAVERPATKASTQATVLLKREAINPELPVIQNGVLKLPDSEVVASQVVDLAESQTVELKLTAKGLSPAGVHNLTVELDGVDPLPIDNRRYVSVLAQQQRPTLVVADDDSVARLLRLMIVAADTDDPESSPLGQQIRFGQLNQVPLERYAVVCLFDPPPLSAQQTKMLVKHVSGGGGLLMILGRNLESIQADQMSAMQDLLPGKLGAVHRLERTNRSCFLQPGVASHPIFQAFAPIAVEEVPWIYFPIYRHWEFGTMSDSVQVLMNYSDGSGPALLSHNLGRGQIVCLTTPLPEPERLERPLWNELTTGADSWPAFFLVQGCVKALSGADQVAVTYAVGESIQLNNDPLQWPSRYDLFTPQAQTRRVESNDGSLALGQFEQPGVYRLRGQMGQPISRSVSVNVPAADTDLSRVTGDVLDQCLGNGNYDIARDRTEIDSSVGQARFGRELYPLLMLFVAGFFLAEQAMSNRFYQLRLGSARPM